MIQVARAQVSLGSKAHQRPQEWSAHHAPRRMPVPRTQKASCRIVIWALSRSESVRCGPAAVTGRLRAVAETDVGCGMSDVGCAKGLTAPSGRADARPPLPPRAAGEERNRFA